MEDICLSGGAEGADQQWGMTAGSAGHTVIHWSFKGHKVHVPASEVVILSAEQLAKADPYLISANEKLQRSFPPKNPYTANLLRRNWYQVCDAQAVYAVSTLKRGAVEGGTAWAVQMFLDRHDGGDCPAYVFDQNTNLWYVWVGGKWTVTDDVPQPKGVWAGIGTRHLSSAGKEAIRRLMGYQPVA